jgi:hypothetical protein
MIDNPQPSSGLSAITVIRRITYAVLAVAGLLAAVIKVKENWQKIFPPPPPKSCYKATLLSPQEVRLSQWASMKLNLNVENTCKEEPFAYVHMKVSAAGLTTAPPFASDASCGPKRDQPSCWEQKQLRKGSSRLGLIPPLLNPLVDRLGDKRQVFINCIVYKEKVDTELITGDTHFWLKDDLPAKDTGNPGRAGQAAAGEAAGGAPGQLKTQLASFKRAPPL